MSPNIIVNGIRFTFFAVRIIFCLVWAQMVYTLLTDGVIYDFKFIGVAAGFTLTLANVCFSWGRSLDSDRHEYSIRRLNRISMGCIFTSMSFLITACANYGLQTSYKNTLKSLLNPVYDIVMLTRYVAIFTACVMVIVIIWQLFKEGLHLFKYEYALMSDRKDGMDSNEEIIPKRLRWYDRRQRVLICLRRNEMMETEIAPEVFKFEKGDVTITVNNNSLERLMELRVYSDGPEGQRVLDIANTSNIHDINRSIREAKASSDNPDLVQEIQFTDQL